MRTADLTHRRGCPSFGMDKGSVWTIGAMLIVFTFVYDFTVSPVTYSLVSELSSTRLKAKTIVLARAASNASKHLCQRHDKLPVELDCMELVYPHSLLLGRQLSVVCRLGILQVARAKGQDIRRARSTV